MHAFVCAPTSVIACMEEWTKPESKLLLEKMEEIRKKLACIFACTHPRDRLRGGVDIGDPLPDPACATAASALASYNPDDPFLISPAAASSACISRADAALAPVRCALRPAVDSRRDGVWGVFWLERVGGWLGVLVRLESKLRESLSPSPRASR